MSLYIVRKLSNGTASLTTARKAVYEAAYISKITTLETIINRKTSRVDQYWGSYSTP